MKSDSFPQGIDPGLLEILACPQCKGKLLHNLERESLDCTRCRLRYRISEGIPVLLIEEAQPF
jgi:hypothetical protein